ncbi:MAG: FkbM family methyltransferase [Panacagrimonas sp.]
MPNSVKVLSGDEYAIELAREPRFIVDAGANVGLAAIYYANKYPGATIVSIEPVASNFALLQRNVAPYPNVLPLLNALWYEPATLEIVDPGWGDDAFRTTNYVAGTVEGNPVQAITVDQIIERYAAKAGVERIDVLKIDIEGAEKELFAAQDGASARRWIDRVDVIAVELHDRFRPGCARAVYNATNGFDYEQRRGYNLFVARSAVLADKGA